MKPLRHLRRPVQPQRVVQPAIAACALLLALGVPCRHAAATVVGASALAADAGALNVTPPAAPDADDAAGPAGAEDGKGADAADAARGPVASVFEDVLREQDPAEVPLSLALMGGVLGILYVRRRKH
jgi:hypothetical protein